MYLKTLPGDGFIVGDFNSSRDEQTASLQAVPPVYRSAVVVIPSAEVLPAIAIQAIRRRYDRWFDRWMPHINLLYGFVPEEYFEEAAHHLGNVAVTGYKYQLMQPVTQTLGKVLKLSGIIV